MNFLLYQAYGQTDILNECLFSILTYYRQLAPGVTPAHVYIYTDNQAYLEPLLRGVPGQVSYVTLTPEQIKTWRGDIDFVHRVKICIMQHFFTLHPQGNLLYVDTDTEFLTDVSGLFTQIEKGRFFMHENECILMGSKASNMARKTGKFVKQRVFSRANGETFTIPLTTRMHNAGVIGMSGLSRHLLADVLDLTDQLYVSFPKHIVEQLAFSYLLQSAGRLESADKQIYHFWFLKELRPLLHEFFQRYASKTFMERVQLSEQFDPAVLSDRKMDYRNLPGFLRMVLKITGQAWKIKPVELK